MGGGGAAGDGGGAEDALAGAVAVAGGTHDVAVGGVGVGDDDVRTRPQVCLVDPRWGWWGGEVGRRGGKR